MGNDEGLLPAHKAEQHIEDPSTAVSSPAAEIGGAHGPHGAMLAAIFEQQPDCVKLVNQAGELLQMNPAGLRMLGIADVAEANRVGLLKFVHPEDRSDFHELHEATCAGEQRSLRFRVVRSDGSLRTLSCTSVPLRDPDLGVLHHLAITRDVSEHVATESALARSQQRLDYVLEEAQVGQWCLDLRTRVATRSAHHDRCFGYPEQLAEWNYDVFLSHVHPLDRSQVQRNVDAVCAGGQRQLDHEFRVIWPDGSEHWLWSRGTVERDANGEPEMLSGICVDITDRKHAEAAAELNYERWKLANRDSKDGLWDWDIRAREVTYSDFWARMLGFEPGELTSAEEEWSGRVHADDVDHSQRSLRNALKGKTASHTVCQRLRCRDGSWKWVLSRGVVIARDSAGYATRMVGSNVDIDQVQREAERVDHLRERLELAVMGSGFGVWELDLASNELIWDQRMHEVYGYTEASFDGNPETWRACLYAQDLEIVDQRLQALLDGQRVELFEFRIRRANDGCERRIEANGYLQRDAMGQPQRLVGMNRDVTERWQMDQRLRLLGSSLANLQEMVLIAEAARPDKEARFVYANPVFYSRTGYQRADLEQLSPFALCDRDENESALSLLKQARQQETAARCDLIAKTRSGDHFWVDLQLVPIGERDQAATHWVLIGLEITARKSAEAQMRLLNASLERRVKERTAALDIIVDELRTFTYSVSHDLHSPLRAILGWTEALSEDCSHLLDDTGRAHLTRIRQGANEMGDLIDGLMRLSRISQADLDCTRFDLAPVSQKIFDGLCQLYTHRQVELQLQSPMWVEADASLLYLCMTNLIENAWKYTQSRDPGLIRIRCRRSARRTVVEVTDNGIGFSMKHASDLWQPFKRINPGDGLAGSGIGLAVVDRIMRRHGGSVEASAEPGQGARFRLIFPRQP